MYTYTRKPKINQVKRNVSLSSTTCSGDLRPIVFEHCCQWQSWTSWSLWRQIVFEHYRQLHDLLEINYMWPLSSTTGTTRNILH